VAPFVLLWALSPMVAYWISLPPRAAAAQPLSDDDVLTLRLTARRTWRFFETFVGSDDHSLPPDNFQETPAPVLAHRTSPTNIGLYLLSTVAARDFGWIGTLDAVERLEATFDTLNGLERFRGHFYNWYDTKSCQPLDPRYVSSVDSGNLAGHLIALAQACEEISEGRPSALPALAGIDDTVALLRLSAGNCASPLGDSLNAFLAALPARGDDVPEWKARFSNMGRRWHIPSRNLMKSCRNFCRTCPLCTFK